MSDTGFKRIYCAPKRWMLHTGIDRLSARSRYILDQSWQRFAAREDGYFVDVKAMPSEIGTIENIRFIKTKET